MWSLFIHHECRSGSERQTNGFSTSMLVKPEEVGCKRKSTERPRHLTRQEKRRGAVEKTTNVE